MASINTKTNVDVLWRRAEETEVLNVYGLSKVVELVQRTSPAGMAPGEGGP